MKLLKGWKKVYEGAEDSDKINRAKAYLLYRSYDLKRMLCEKLFKDYDKTLDFKRFIKST